MAKITLFDNGTENYILNTDEHRVKDPQRALNKFKNSYYKNLILWLLIGFGALITIFNLVVIKPFGIDLIGDLKNAEYSLFNVIKFVSIMFLPVYFFVSLYKIAKSIKRINSPITRSTPEETLIFFLDSLGHSYYEPAYNCLTDTAKKSEISTYSKEKFIREKISIVNDFETVDKFKKHWNYFSVDLDWKDEDIKKEEIDSNTVLLNLPIKYKLEENAPIDPLQPSIADTVTYNYSKDFPFVLIKKDKFWFICNGYLLFKE